MTAAQSGENGVLREAFRHSAWATTQLLAFCRDLSDQQLISSAAGTFGDVLGTFRHYIASDTQYLRRLAGAGPAWADDASAVDLDELGRRVEESAAGWERLLAEPLDAERIYEVDDGAYKVRAGVIVTQALFHAAVHREQVCAIITGLGVEPPDLQPWEYAWDTGRIWDAS